MKFKEFYGDEGNGSANENNDPNHYRTNNNKTTVNKSFEHMTKLIRTTPDKNSRLNTQVGIPLKYLNDFWRSLDLSLINWEIELDLTWSKNIKNT